jgi:cysteine desulfurase
MKNNTLIYLDNNSTTKVDPRVIDAMMPYFSEYYGNSSSSHELGAKSLEAVKDSRTMIAELIEAKESEIFFTSGATESINLVLQGIISNSTKNKPHIITSVTEHPAVLDTCRFLEHRGVDITYLQVSSQGIIDLEDLKAAITENTILITVMYANNETGVIQPIKQISDIGHSKGVLFMTDATQVVGKVKISVENLGIDILCFSGHKFYAPKGIGGVYLRARRPFKVRVPALIHGGGHENGIRSGTLNVPGIVGIGKAARISIEQMRKDEERISTLRDKLQRELLLMPNTFVNGKDTPRIYTTTNICFEGADADAVIVGLKNIAVSNGSACSSISVEPSHVLKAMGKTDLQAFSSLRFSLGRFNTEKEINTTIEKVRKIVMQLREMR